METKKVAKEYLQKDILRTIFQMRKRQEDDKQIKKIIVLDYDLTEYHWKTNIKKLQEEGWYQNMHGIWKRAEVNDHSIKIPATAFHIEYEQQWLGEIHFTYNLGFVAEEKKGSKKKTICLLDGRLLQKIPDIV